MPKLTWASPRVSYSIFATPGEHRTVSWHKPAKRGTCTGLSRLVQVLQRVGRGQGDDLMQGEGKGKIWGGGWEESRCRARIQLFHSLLGLLGEVSGCNHLLRLLSPPGVA